MLKSAFLPDEVPRGARGGEGGRGSGTTRRACARIARGGGVRGARFRSERKGGGGEEEAEAAAAAAAAAAAHLAR